METGLKGRVVLVTGASQGIARAAAEIFANEGAKLAICARTEKTIREAERELQAKHAGDVLAEVVDVTDATGVERFVAKVAERFGAVDVCVANAGGPPAKNFLSTTMDEWRKATEMSFLSVVSLARAVIPHMQRKCWGRFIAITSVSVKQPVPDLVL